jgi:ATP-dependent Clp protease ATP-binding subunit ClpC
VTVLATEEARRLSHSYLGTEHLLLGLIHEGEGVAAQVLAALNIELDAVRKEVERIIGFGQRAPSGHIPFTPRAKKVLELALREALQLGNNYIGTEHILLGIISEGEGVAAQVLVTLGADLETTRMKVVEVVGGDRREPGGNKPERNMQVWNILNRLAQRPDDHEVVDYQFMTTEKNGEITETLTIRWRPQ